MNTSNRNSRIKVFVYHRILEEGAEKEKMRDWHAVSEKNFKKQLKILDSLNFTTITFKDYQLYLDNKLALPKKPVILTFDDGHLDTYEVALPILKKFGMCAVIFAIGNRNLRYALWDQKYEGRCPLMTDDQIRLAHGAGFEIGAHTMTHPTLTNLSREEMVEEINGSKKSLENLLGEEILSFAYPYGRLNRRVYELTQKAGFKFACGVDKGPINFGDDIFNIRRISLTYKTGIFSYLAKLSVAYEYWHKINRRYSKPSERSVDEINIPKVDYEKSIRKPETN